MRLLRFLLALVPLAICSYAQKNPVLPPDDPKLYQAFFLNPSLQGQVRLNTTEAQNLITISQAAAQRFKDFDARFQASLASSSAKVNPAAPQAQDSAHYLLAIRGRNDLRRGLSNPALQQVRAYLNGPLRDAVNAGLVPVDGGR